MKKRISLEELELLLPKIELKETKFLLGGTGYDNPDNGTVANLPDGAIPAEDPDEGDGNPPEDPNDPPVDDGNHGGEPEDGDPGEGGQDEGDGNHGEDGSEGGQGEAGQGDGYHDEEDPDYGDGEQGNEGDYDPDPSDGGYGGGNNGGSNGGPSGPSGGSPDIPGSWTDGISADNGFFHFDSSLLQNTELNNQVQHILNSNSVISGLLGYFNNGNLNLTFEVGDSDGIAHLDHSNPNNFVMVFNPSNINQGGFIGLNGIDNAGYDHSGLTDVESLAIVIAHEAMHAKHMAVFQAFSNQNNGIAEDTRDALLNHGYSQEFVDIFFYPTTNPQTGADTFAFNADSTVSDNLHSFMDQFNDQVFDAVLQELNNDMQEYQDYLQDLNDYMNNNNGDDDPGGPGSEEQDGPG